MKAIASSKTKNQRTSALALLARICSQHVFEVVPLGIGDGVIWGLEEEHKVEVVCGSVRDAALEGRRL